MTNDDDDDDDTHDLRRRTRGTSAPLLFFVSTLITIDIVVSINQEVTYTNTHTLIRYYIIHVHALSHPVPYRLSLANSLPLSPVKYKT